MIRASALISVLLLAAACGTSAPVKCTTANCSGCCSEAGECLGPTKQSPQSCGREGGACRVCLPQQLCASGGCVTNPDASIPFEDAGAVEPEVDAGRPDAAVQCGTEGQPCCASQTCYAPLACQRGLCQTPGAVTDAGACGRVGQQCCANQTCTEAGTSCNGTTCFALTPDGGVDAGPAQKALGEACSVDRDCRDGVCLVLGFTGGYCTKGCTAATDCNSGSQCAVNTSGSGPAKICFKQCPTGGQAPGGCRTGYVCEANAGTSGVPICYPGCQSAAACGLAPTCDTRGFCCGGNGFVCCEGTTCQSGNTCTNGTCRTATVACGGAGQACCTSGTACTGQQRCVSNACTACGGLGQPCCEAGVCSAGECLSGTCQNRVVNGVGGACTDYVYDCGTGLDVCIQPSGTDWQGGYCSKECSSVSCPGGSSCSSIIAPGSKYCLQDCAWDGGAGGCRSGYVCDRFLIAGEPNKATCYPACTSDPGCNTGRCENGFCCGDRGFRCCAGNTCPRGGACSNGYCQ